MADTMTDVPTDSTPTVVNEWLEGNFAPVHDEHTITELEVDGEIPPDLDGRLLRIGPNPVTPPDPSTYHWFTGTGMVHGLRLRDGKAEWYRNRFVRNSDVVEARGGPPVPGPRAEMFDGANTNVIGLAGKTFAIVEAGSHPVELTHDLETVANSDFDGTLPAGFTAHPHRDPDTGERHAVAYQWDLPYLQYLTIGTNGAVRRVVQVPVDDGPMVHDCAITESSVLLFDQPVTFDLELGMEGRFPYRWNPGHASRVAVLPRDGEADDVRWCEAPLCYVFHPLNAYDLPDGRIVVDLVKHPSMFDHRLDGPDEGTPVLERWTLDPANGTTSTETISDRGQEFPRLDERLTGRRHRFGYSASFDERPGHVPSLGSILKHDVERGSTEVHDFGPGVGAQEPVFVPRAADSDEDDGWVMVYAHDQARNAADVHILHAQDFGGAPVATIHLPVRVPYGFHGNWVAESGS